MIVCVSCGREMKVAKNGVGADFGNGHVYAGDKYECPKCGVCILKCNASANYDSDYTNHDEYVECHEKGTG